MGHIRGERERNLSMKWVKSCWIHSRPAVNRRYLVLMTMICCCCFFRRCAGHLNLWFESGKKSGAIKATLLLRSSSVSSDDSVQSSNVTFQVGRYSFESTKVGPCDLITNQKFRTHIIIIFFHNLGTCLFQITSQTRVPLDKLNVYSVRLTWNEIDNWKHNMAAFNEWLPNNEDANSKYWMNNG